MNYIFILIGTLFAATIVTQMLAYAAFTRKKKVEVRWTHNHQA